MSLIAYMDESGDHSLANIDHNFPIFVLVILICDSNEYIQSIVPAVYRFKFAHWGHEGTILHSRDIRRAQADFAFLTNKSKRLLCYEGINNIIRSAKCSIISTAIKKQEIASKFISAKNIYELAFEHNMETLVEFLEDNAQDQISIVAESRGKTEDKELERRFYHIVNNGTENIDVIRFRKIQFKFILKPKSLNIVGAQLADLIAYPTARWVLNVESQPKTFRIFKDKFYIKNGMQIGLKILP